MFLLIRPMPHLYQAIIHLKSDAERQWSIVDRLRPMLSTFPGVRSVIVESTEDTVAIEFDHDRTGVGDLIRAIEDSGTLVAGVAQRRMEEPDVLDA
jgi:hypothetical protein